MIKIIKRTLKNLIKFNYKLFDIIMAILKNTLIYFNNTLRILENEPILINICPITCPIKVYLN